jgi:bacterial/archaeal transporter family protein
MPKWLLYSILTVLLWGVWGFESKVALAKLSPMLNQVLFTLGLVPLVMSVSLSKQAMAGTNKLRGAVFALTTGMLGGVGNVTFFEALAHDGKASTVVPITGLYPLFTVVTALPLLGEKLNRVQAIGIILAVLAILLLSSG